MTVLRPSRLPLALALRLAGRGEEDTERGLVLALGTVTLVIVEHLQTAGSAPPRRLSPSDF